MTAMKFLVYNAEVFEMLCKSLFSLWVRYQLYFHSNSGSVSCLSGSETCVHSPAGTRVQPADTRRLATGLSRRDSCMQSRYPHFVCAPFREHDYYLSWTPVYGLCPVDLAVFS